MVKDLTICFEPKVNTESNFGEFSGDDSNEFFVTDSSITILVSIVDHLINFSWGESFSNRVTNSFEVFWAEGVGSFGIKNFIKLLKRLLRGLFILSEDGKESAEVEFFSISVGLDDSDDICGLAFHIEGSDCVNDFLHGDLSAVVVVEEIEHFLELGDSLNVHGLVGVFCWIESLN